MRLDLRLGWADAGRRLLDGSGALPAGRAARVLMEVPFAGSLALAERLRPIATAGLTPSSHPERADGVAQIRARFCASRSRAAPPGECQQPARGPGTTRQTGLAPRPRRSRRPCRLGRAPQLAPPFLDEAHRIARHGWGAPTPSSTARPRGPSGWRLLRSRGGGRAGMGDSISIWRTLASRSRGRPMCSSVCSSSPRRPWRSSARGGRARGRLERQSGASFWSRFSSPRRQRVVTGQVTEDASSCSPIGWSRLVRPAPLPTPRSPAGGGKPASAISSSDGSRASCVRGALGRVHLLHALDDVDRNADRPCLVGDRPSDCLADHQVAYVELEPALPLELLDRGSARTCLPGSGRGRAALVAVVLGDRDDQAEVARSSAASRPCRRARCAQARLRLQRSGRVTPDLAQGRAAARRWSSPAPPCRGARRRLLLRSTTSIPRSSSSLCSASTCRARDRAARAPRAARRPRRHRTRRRAPAAAGSSC